MEDETPEISKERSDELLKKWENVLNSNTSLSSCKAMLIEPQVQWVISNDEN